MVEAKSGGLMTVLGATTFGAAALQIAKGKQESAVADYDADALKNQAKSVQAATSEEHARVLRRNERILSMQRNLLGSSGLSSQGTLSTALGDTAADLSRESSDVLNRGYYETSALKTKAKITHIQGDMAETAGYIAAGNTILGTATSFAKVGAGP